MNPMRIAFFCNNDFNLGAAYVIGYLKTQGHDIRLFFNYRKDYIQSYNPELICFSCVTANIAWGLKIAKEIKKYSKARILFGGVHTTLCPEDVEREGFEVCQGDGISHFGGQFEPDILWPDREIFLKQLPPHARRYQLFMTGFGCPFKCSFCNSPQLHKKLIRRSVEGCIEELKYLKSIGMKYVLFVDDVFTINKEWLVNFLDSYRRNIVLPFTCFGHSKCISDDITPLLRRSKCECVWLGVQSGSEITRKDILNRHETNEEISKACECIKRSKLKLMIDHIFGLPFDSYEKIVESFNFYKSLKPDIVNAYELLYFPKTDICKYGVPENKALYQRQGGLDYKKYSKAFTTIPLLVN